MSCAVCKMSRAVDSADEEEEQAEEDCPELVPIEAKQREVKEEEWGRGGEHPQGEIPLRIPGLASLAPGSRQTRKAGPRPVGGGAGWPQACRGGRGGLLEASCTVSLAWEDRPCQTQSPQDSCDPIALSCPKDVNFYRAYLA